MTGKLSPSFHLSDMLKSYTATKEQIFEQFVPNDTIIDCLALLCTELLQPIHDYLYGKYGNAKLQITSGYRCERLNKIVLGKTNSQHLKGQAADLQFFIGEKVHNEEILEAVKELGLEFDHMIWEYGGKWVHLSFSKGKNRNQELKT